LAAGIAHDFNNILTTIIGYNYLLLEELKPDSPLREYSREIQDSVNVAGGLARQFMTLGRRKGLQPRVIDVRTVVLGMSKMLRRIVGENIHLSLERGTSAWPVKMDIGQLEQIVLNLVINARDAMPKGGQLTITTKNIAVKEDPSNLGLDVTLPPGQYLELKIRDTGIGMDAATMARIFDPFFTTKGPGRGTGLGLSAVQEIVKQYGGSLSVKSEPGRGSVFCVFLPRVKEAARPLLSSRAAKAVKGGHETILVVEDNDATRALLKRALTGNGYRVFSASTAELAESHCKNIKEHIDLLLTDMILPDLDGAQLATKLTALRPGMKVLFMSGYPGGSMDVTSLPSDCMLLEKPFSPDALLTTIRHILDATLSHLT
jgi:CheY-like chemotaxis protein